MPYKKAESHTAYQNGYLKGMRRAYLEMLGPCAHCGSWDDLELDHIDPTTKVTHRIWSLSREEREAEIAKCQALCHVCHLTKTAEQRRLKTS